MLLSEIYSDEYQENEIDFLAEPEYQYWASLTDEEAESKSPNEQWILDFACKYQANKSFAQYYSTFKSSKNIFLKVRDIVHDFSNAKAKRFSDSFYEIKLTLDEIPPGHNGKIYNGNLYLDLGHPVTLPPEKFKFVKAVFVDDLTFDEMKSWFPEEVDTVDFGNNINDFSGIHKVVKKAKRLLLQAPHKNIVGIMKIEGLKAVEFVVKSKFTILNDIIHNNLINKDMLQFQQDLIEAGFEDLAGL